MKKQGRWSWRSIRNRELWRKVVTVAVTIAMVLQLSPIGYVGADTNQTVDTTATKTDDAKVAVKLDGAYLTVNNQPVEKDATLTTSADADFTFKAAANNGYENLKVTVTVNGAETELTAADGSYKLSKDQVQAGATITAKATKKADAEKATTTPVADKTTDSKDDADSKADTTSSTSATTPTDTTPTTETTTTPAATDKPVAIDATGYDTIADAVAAATDGRTITLNQDVKESVTLDKAVTLNLNGHTLTGNGGSVVTIKADATVTNGTITGGTGTAIAARWGTYTYGGGVYVAAGNATITKVTLTGNTSPYDGSAIVARDSAQSLTIDQCTITGNTSNYGTTVGASVGNVTISNTTIKGNKGSSWGGIDVYGGNKVTLTNNVVGDNGSGSADIVARATVGNDSTVTFNGGGSYSGAVILAANHVVADGSGMTNSDGFALSAEPSVDAKVSNFTFSGFTQVSKQNGTLLKVGDMASGATATVSNVTIENCDLTSASRTDASPIQLQTGSSNSSITLDKVRVTNCKTTRQVVYVSAYGVGNDVTINNSSFTGNVSAYAAVNVTAGSLTLNNTVVKGNQSTSNPNGKWKNVYAGGIRVDGGSFLYVYGGAIAGNLDLNGNACDVAAKNGATITLPKASAMSDGATDYSNYEWNRNGDTSMAEYSSFGCSSDTTIYAEQHQVHYVAAVGDQQYETLGEAFDAIRAGSDKSTTVKLVAEGSDVTTPFLWVPYFGYNTTLDLNGHRLSRSKGESGATLGTWHGNLVIENTSETSSTYNAPLYMEPGNGGDVTVISNTTIDGVTYGNVTLPASYWQYVGKGTLTLKGTFTNSMWLNVKSSTGHVAADANTTLSDGTTLYIYLNDVDGSTLAQYTDDTSTPDDLILVKGGSDALAKQVSVYGLANNGKAVVQYDATKDAIVLHKMGTIIYVNGEKGDDANDGTEASPVKTMGQALKLYHGATGAEGIFVTGTVTTSGDESWDGSASQSSDPLATTANADEATSGNVVVYRDPSFKGNLVKVPEGSSLTLSNITLDGNKKNVIGTESLVVAEGDLTLNGGAILQNNDAYDFGSLKLGGAIEAGNKSAVTLNGGSKVEGNRASWGGGIYSAGTVYLKGGTVDNNKAEDTSSFSSAGGGIMMNNYYGGASAGMAAHLVFESGTVSNNYAGNHGGGIALRSDNMYGYEHGEQVTLDMTGGTVDGNTANNTGGGIFVQACSTANVSGGDITNNTANGSPQMTGQTSVFVGGGIYVNGVNRSDRGTYTNGLLNLTNAVITDNESGWDGGGFAACPTSSVRIYLTNGAAIYQNKSDSSIDEVYTQAGLVGHHSGTPDILVSPVMLGGGSYRWTYATDTGDHKAGDLVDTTTLAGTTVIALNNAITADSPEAKAAQGLAKVHITGNKAAGKGGGIGTDGDVTIGTRTDYTDISAQKAWKTVDGTTNLPDSVTMVLQSQTTDGTWTDTAYQTATKDNGWKVTFQKLPQGVTYRVVEKDENLAGADTGTKLSDVFDSEAKQEDDGSFTVTNTEKTTSVKATKVWADADNQDGKRTDVSLHLMKSVDGGEATVVEGQDKTIKADATGDDLTATWDNLPLYEAGKAVTYSVVEDQASVPQGYTSEVTGSVADGFTVTNTHTPETTEVKGTKTWDDADNQDGKRPASITVRLLADGTEVDSKTVTAADNWQYSFTGLPKYKAGKEITYTVEEDKVADYTTAVDGFDITNTHTPATTEVKGLKVWDDKGDQDGKRPASITVDLYADGVKYASQQVSPDADGLWSYSFTNLPVYQKGVKVAYTVVEEPVEGYTATYKGTALITNTHTPGVTEVSGTKTWDDANDQDGLRPAFIRVSLYKQAQGSDDKVLVDGQNVVADPVTGAWTYSFKNLPEYEVGKKLTYSVAEAPVAGYASTVSGFDIANAHTPETVEVKGTKTWDDSDNQDGIRPASITVRLLADGAEVDSKVVTAADNWSYDFGSLPKYKAGKEIAYTVTEDEVEGYTAKVEGFDITNAHTPETTEVKGTKTWDDSDNQDGARPESITVRLLADGTEVDSKVVTAADNWSYDFGSLPKFNQGKEISYTVAEDEVAGYTTKVDGYDVTNTHTPEVTTIKATKVWDDGDNRDGLRANVTLHLMKSVDGGEPTVVEGKDKVISAAATGDDLTATWDDLPLYEDGKAISYSVAEEPIQGYASEVTGSMADGYTVTNTHRFATWMPTAKKFYAGAMAGETAAFDFTLTEMQGTDKADGSFEVSPRTDGDAVTRNLTNGAFDANGEAALVMKDGSDGLSLQPGTYYYQLAEVIPDGDAQGYDEARYDIRVVVDDSYQVTTTYELEADGTTTLLGTDASQVEFFNNSYQGYVAAMGLGAGESGKGGKAMVQPTVRKVLENGALTQDEFTFTLTDEKTGEVLSTAKNDANGQVAFDQLTYTTANEGEHNYKITEVGGGTTTNGITYDGGTVTMKVTVSEANGQLTAEATYSKDGSQTDDPTFTNKADTLQVTVRKANREDTSVGLYHAVYGLWMYNANGADVYLGNRTSDHDGYMTFDVPTEAGKVYYFKEESSPDGYLVDPYRSVAFTVVTENDGSHRLVYESTDEFNQITNGMKLTGRGIGASASQEVE